MMIGKKIIFIGLLCCIFLLLYIYNYRENMTRHIDNFLAMDTQISFIVYGNNAETALQLAKVRIMQLEDLLSVTDKCSDVYAINHSEGNLIKISNDTSNIIQFALNMAKDTDGALDPTIYPLLKVWGFTTDNYKIPDEKSIAELLPYIDYKKVKLINNTIILPKGMELDLGAVAKGYTSDEVIKLWRSQGISSALINLGGNVQTLGVKPDGSLWKIGIKAPQGAGNLGVLQIGETAVITSGSYERYFIGEDGKKYWHILNPVTGKPAQSGFKSVTIVGDSGKQCDALSTAIFVMGKQKAVDYWQAKRNFEMILVTQENEIWITEGIVNAFTLQPEYADLTMRVIK